MDDETIENVRKNVFGLKFTWMKFHTNKNDKFSPGFIHPLSKDGKLKAQWILANGNLSIKRKEYFEFDDELPEDKKEQSDKLALDKFNKKFRFDYK